MTSISSEELCEQSMEYLYKTIYVDGTMADPINFEKYTYNSVPKCFTLIDTEALSSLESYRYRIIPHWD